MTMRKKYPKESKLDAISCIFVTQPDTLYTYSNRIARDAIKANYVVCF